MRLDTFDGSDTKPVEAGGADSTILFVVEFEPVVNLLDVPETVVVVRWWGAIGFKPHKLRRIEDGGDDQFILGMGMVSILLVNGFLQCDEPLHYGVPIGPPEKVIQASSDKDPHGPGLPPVVHLEGVDQVWDGPTGDGHPVNVEGVWGTDDTGVPGLVEVVELAGTQAHIEPIVREGGVHSTAGWTHVVPVVPGVLHTLEDADFSGGGVQVEQGVGPVLVLLSVTADHAVRSHLVLYSAAVLGELVSSVLGLCWVCAGSGLGLG